jgi:hypothetical protein
MHWHEARLYFSISSLTRENSLTPIKRQLTNYLIDESEELDAILEDGGERRGESECDLPQ